MSMEKTTITISDNSGIEQDHKINKLIFDLKTVCR